MYPPNNIKEPVQVYICKRSPRIRTGNVVMYVTWRYVYPYGEYITGTLHYYSDCIHVVHTSSYCIIRVPSRGAIVLKISCTDKVCVQHYTTERSSLRGRTRIHVRQLLVYTFCSRCY